MPAISRKECERRARSLLGTDRAFARKVYGGPCGIWLNNHDGVLGELSYPVPVAGGRDYAECLDKISHGVIYPEARLALVLLKNGPRAATP